MKIPPFIIELVKRVATNNPTFFKWVQGISALVAVAAFVPDLLAYLDIESPSWLEILHDKAIKIGALTAILMGQLPNAEPKKVPDEEPISGLTVGGRPDDRNPPPPPPPTNP